MYLDVGVPLFPPIPPRKRMGLTTDERTPEVKLSLTFSKATSNCILDGYSNKKLCLNCYLPNALDSEFCTNKHCRKLLGEPKPMEGTRPSKTKMHWIKGKECIECGLDTLWQTYITKIYTS